MTVLRATQRVLRFLPPATADPAAAPDSALGDWFVNRIVVDRQPLLVLVSSASLLPMVLPARDVRGLPERLPDLVGQRLDRLGMAPELIRAEVRAMGPVGVGPTNNRSVLGSLNEFCWMVPHYLSHLPRGETQLIDVERKLEDTPCRVMRRFEDVVFPDRRTAELLMRRWAT